MSNPETPCTCEPKNAGVLMQDPGLMRTWIHAADCPDANAPKAEAPPSWDYCIRCQSVQVRGEMCPRDPSGGEHEAFSWEAGGMPHRKESSIHEAVCPRSNPSEQLPSNVLCQCLKRPKAEAPRCNCRVDIGHVCHSSACVPVCQHHIPGCPERKAEAPPAPKCKHAPTPDRVCQHCPPAPKRNCLCHCHACKKGCPCPEGGRCCPCLCSAEYGLPENHDERCPKYKPAPPAPVSEPPIDHRFEAMYGTWKAEQAISAALRSERDTLKADREQLRGLVEEYIGTVNALKAQNATQAQELERMRENVGVKYGATGMCQDKHRMVMFPGAGGWGENCPMCAERAELERLRDLIVSELCNDGACVTVPHSHEICAAARAIRAAREAGKA